MRILVGMVCCVTALMAAGQTLDLSGDWKVSVNGETFNINLPGTLDMANIGEPSGLSPAMTKPQLLRLTRKYSYIGPAVYSRVIEIPGEMAGKPMRLKMERVFWKSSLKVDGKEIEGYERSLVSPHYFDLPPLNCGKHLLEITIDNSKQEDISVNNLCHSYTNDTQTIWNGVLGEFSIGVVPQLEVKGVDVYPDIAKGNVKIDVWILNHGKKPAAGQLHLTATDKNNGNREADKKVKVKVQPGMSKITTELEMKAASLWNEFNPQLYDLNVSTGKSEKAVTFGMREVTIQGKSLLVNGKRVFLRGTLDCCVFPLTGVPPTDRNGWVKEMRTLKEWGFNHIRFHSWCPPEAAFEVADSLGIYLQVELPVWSTNFGDDPGVADFLREEFENMRNSYGNHPSWLMTTCGNEMQYDFDTLNDMVREMREKDPRHLYSATSFTFEKGHGGHAEPYDQFLVTQWTDDGWVRGQGVFDEEPPSFDRNYASAMGCVRIPLVSHEIGQYAVYPNIEEIKKYTGVLEPLNFMAIKEDLADKGLLEKASRYLEATGKFANLLYKEEIERAMKTPGFSGVQLLGIQDFPGQGTALVGLLDSFWDSKGVANGEEFKRFNSPVTPLANFPKAVYAVTEPFKASIDVANYSDSDIKDPRICWILSDSTGNRIEGIMTVAELAQGDVTTVGSMETALKGFAAPSKLTFAVSLPATDYSNSWNIWVYPEIREVKTGEVVIAHTPAEAVEALGKGEKVLYFPPIEKIKGIESKFLPVFWSPVHFPKQAGGMGVLAQTNHPALQGFPTDCHSDWQWWRPVKNARVMLLDSVRDIRNDSHVEPIVGAVDNFLHNRRLGYLFEARCGNGKLMVSSIDLEKEDPEMKSFLQGLADYMNSVDFNPQLEISPETLKGLTVDNENNLKTNSISIYQ